MSIFHINNLSIYHIDNFLYLRHIYNIYIICRNIVYIIYWHDDFFYTQYRQKCFSIPDEEKISIPDIEKCFMSICHIYKLYTCGIDKTYISILGIYKLSILCIDNTSPYDVDKPKFLLHNGTFSTLFNFINAVIHNNHKFHTFHIKD